MPDKMNVLSQFSGLDVDAERLDMIRQAFAEIHREIELLRTFNLDETHPAVVFRPIERRQE